MASRKDKRNKSFLFNRKIKNNLDLLDRSLTDIYSDTYYSTKTNLDDASKIRSDIEKSVETIMNNNLNNSSISNIAKIYTKINDTDTNLLQAIKDINDDSISQTVLSTWMQNGWIKQLRNEIDMVLKYVPKLKEALLCKKDCVLSADHFSKEFLSFVNILSTQKEELFNNRMEELKKVYRLPEKIEEWYDEISTYGAQALWIVPYSEEFERLLKKKKEINHLNSYTTESGVFINENNIITEANITFNEHYAIANKIDNNTIEYAKSIGLDKISISIDNSGILESAVTGIKKARAIYESSTLTGVGTLFTESYLNESHVQEAKMDSKVVPDDLDFPDKLEDEHTPSEMLIDKKSNNNDRIKVDVPGCIIKELDEENLLPLYIDDLCLGYYYIETSGNYKGMFDPNSFEYAAGFNTVANGRRFTRQIGGDFDNPDEKNKLIDHIAGEIYKLIDTKFINDNQELRKEIYMILKHNELFNNESNIQDGQVKVTFLSADDVEYMAFNIDKKTHRGESDLKYSLFPAKLYACLYITNVLGIITRGQDKRVYYVKQNIDTNISKTLLNVINQIKKGNFGARQMDDNLGNVLNITGKFNDMVIPTNSSGDPPISIEVMDGQRFTDNSELMTILEKNSIDPIVPYDLIEARQSLDYAIQATMSNSKLMRNTYKRQDIEESFLSRIITKIYNYEYEEQEEIKVVLPAPAFINATNGEQMVTGTSNFINAIIESELADEPDEVKMEFKRLSLRYYLPSQLNLSLIDRFKVEARINVANKNNGNEE